MNLIDDLGADEIPDRLDLTRPVISVRGKCVRSWEAHFAISYLIVLRTIVSVERKVRRSTNER